MAQVMEKTFCLPCRVGFHRECNDLWLPGMTPKDPCCCEGIDFWAESPPTVSDDTELTPADLAYFDGFTGTKKLEEYADPVSTGRKEAAVKFPIEKGMACEWKYLAQAGGGVAPIVGCVGYPATDIHHGPDKNTLHNTPDNVHRICAHCHNRWHALNDPYYPAERPPADEPFLPEGDKPCLLHDPSTKATDDIVFAEEKRRRDDSRRHGNLD